MIMEKDCKTIVELKHLSKAYGERKLFQDFNLTVKEGEMICIAGPSGSGKSTILNMIGMFEKPDQGEIYFKGEILPTPSTKAGRKIMHDHIFYLFQNFALVEDESIDYNLEIPLMDTKITKKAKRQMKEKALAKVGLSASLKEKIFHLSGGEQQRAAIARGYLREFDLILADEPTGSLDEKNRDEVIKLLKGFQQEGKTVIIVSHDPVVMESCERIIKIQPI